MNLDKKQKTISYWLFTGVAMLIIQVLLGGITRLTGSGLSITEWKPIMGALPPANEAAWQQAFESYKNIAQYKYLNNHFSIEDFKFIFFWEWFHRLWARFMGLVFLIPFIFFLVKGYFKKGMIMPLVILFFLGGFQGLIGWLMVSTGLNNEDLYVSHFALAIHFMSAMVLTVYVFWFAMQLRISAQKINAPALRKNTVILTAILAVQLIYGCFMAGLKAAQVAPTWPSINGKLWPDSMLENGIKSAFFDVTTIQFIHRMLAYLITILIFFWWRKARKIEHNGSVQRLIKWPFILVCAQVLLGIASLLTSTTSIRGQFGQFEWMALLHQFNGMLLLLSLIAVIFLSGKKESIVRNSDT